MFWKVFINKLKVSDSIVVASLYISLSIKVTILLANSLDLEENDVFRTSE